MPSPAAMARPANVGFGGFTTGNGAAVTVSEDAARRARADSSGTRARSRRPSTETPRGSVLDARTAKSRGAGRPRRRHRGETRETVVDSFARARERPPRVCDAPRGAETGGGVRGGDATRARDARRVERRRGDDDERDSQDGDGGADDARNSSSSSRRTRFVRRDTRGFGRVRVCDWERRDRRRLRRRGVGTRAGFIRRRAAGETPRGGARGVALASVAGARVGGERRRRRRRRGIQTAVRGTRARGEYRSYLPFAHASRRGTARGDRATRRRVDSRETPSDRIRIRARVFGAVRARLVRVLATGLANPCPCFSAVLSRTSAPRLLAGWTRSSAR